MSAWCLSDNLQYVDAKHLCEWLLYIPLWRFRCLDKELNCSCSLLANSKCFELSTVIMLDRNWLLGHGLHKQRNSCQCILQPAVKDKINYQAGYDGSHISTRILWMNAILSTLWKHLNQSILRVAYLDSGSLVSHRPLTY